MSSPATRRGRSGCWPNRTRWRDVAHLLRDGASPKLFGSVYFQPGSVYYGSPILQGVDITADRVVDVIRRLDGVARAAERIEAPDVVSEPNRFERFAKRRPVAVGCLFLGGCLAALMVLALLLTAVIVPSAIAVWASAASSHALAPPCALVAKENTIHRLVPSAFSDLPGAIKTDLESRGCTIPQTYMESEPHNVIGGNFRQPGQQGLGSPLLEERETRQSSSTGRVRT